MKERTDQFAIRYRDHKSPEEHEFIGDQKFPLDSTSIIDDLMIPLSPRMHDLLRIASSVYFVDRLVRRDRKNITDRWSRHLSCSIEVDDAAFWKRDSIAFLVRDALQFVSGDNWNLEFQQDANSNRRTYKHLFNANMVFPIPPVVCLYSGGLDSAAGLARRLRNGAKEELLPVIVRHRSDIAKKSKYQIELLNREYKTDLRPVCVNMSMINPKKFVGSEESSQRTRSFLFVAVGGVIAWATKASKLELFESGIGAINFPLSSRMQGSQATRSTHPKFLQKMSRLLSEISERQIEVILPFEDHTKGEVVSTFNTEELREIARSTVSCVSYPLRRLTGKSCGLCPACIFRRVALNTADICESTDTYQYDILDFSSGVPPRKKMKYLMAFLNHVDILEETYHGCLPESLIRHLQRTELIKRNSQLDTYIDLYRRYRYEWLDFVRKAKNNGCKWADQINLPSKAA